MPNHRPAPPRDPAQPDLARLAAAPLANPIAPFLPLGKRRRARAAKGAPPPQGALPLDLPHSPKETRRAREYRRLVHDRAGLLDHYAGSDRPVEAIAANVGLPVEETLRELAKREAALDRPEVRAMRAFVAGQTARATGKRCAVPSALDPAEAEQWRAGWAHGVEEEPQ